MNPLLLLIPACFVTALLYGSVGLGGGSAYLALLVLADLPHQEIPATALLLNLLVAGGAFLHFRQRGYFSWLRLLPFATTSIPAAFLGGLLPVSRATFGLLLAAILVLVALRLTVGPQPEAPSRSTPARRVWLVGLPLGAVLGLLAGIVGIGGGIFLAPILLFLGWAGAREAAAASSGFIVLNSLAGLLAHSLRGTVEVSLLLPLGLTVLAGGQLGSFLGATRFSPLLLRRTFAGLLLVAALRLGSQAL